MNKSLIFFVLCGYLLSNGYIGSVKIYEQRGLDRSAEYVEIEIPNCLTKLTNNILAINKTNLDTILCQVTKKVNISNGYLHKTIIFPVDISAYDSLSFDINVSESNDRTSGTPYNIKLTGEKTEIIVENDFYIADLRANEKDEEKSFHSGQITDLTIKLGFNKLLTNRDDRIHWAPNFKRPEIEYYKTIAHWNNPKEQWNNTGEYLIRTWRKDGAPSHPEIMLSAEYSFFAGKPYFLFNSNMEIINDVMLEWLRNDEMTMDTMFTNLAFKRKTGEIIDIPIAERGEILEKSPIAVDDPWLCFYNKDIGYGFGSIRLDYDISNMEGNASPTGVNYTSIAEWENRTTYWNRRIIYNELTDVAKGSKYIEKNAYIVFDINQGEHLEAINKWSELLMYPLIVKTTYKY
ncbi:hypothetical protein ACFL0J_05435 [Candidatus Neomarinimicrobiota bacterium]